MLVDGRLRHVLESTGDLPTDAAAGERDVEAFWRQRQSQ
jgi:hypothetical protein